MSSFKKASKASGRMHRERSQPEYRQRLGMLEKKKDYRQRAMDHQAKEKMLKRLRQKALSRNADEFYFKMINTSLENGVHQCEESAAPVYTDEQLRLMMSQDIKYIKHKRQIELKKISKLQSSLHLLDAPDIQPKLHIVYVDSKEDAKKILKGPEKSGSSTSVVIHRRHERLAHLPQVVLANSKQQGTSLTSKQAYRQLKTRLARLEQLTVILAKMQTKQRIHAEDTSSRQSSFSSGNVGKPTLIIPESTENAAIYRWPKQRLK